jgi:hypothetical protein
MIPRLLPALVVLGSTALVAGGFSLFGSDGKFTQTPPVVFVLAGITILFNAWILYSVLDAIRRLQEDLSSQIRTVLAATSAPAQPVAFPALQSLSADQDLEQRPQWVSQYFYGDSAGNEVGPIDDAAMRHLVASGSIMSDTPVYRRGTGVWATLADFPELAAFANVHGGIAPDLSFK